MAGTGPPGFERLPATFWSRGRPLLNAALDRMSRFSDSHSRPATGGCQRRHVVRSETVSFGLKLDANPCSQPQDRRDRRIGEGCSILADPGGTAQRVPFQTTQNSRDRIGYAACADSNGSPVRLDYNSKMPVPSPYAAECHRILSRPWSNGCDLETYQNRFLRA
jgi:hypothetical protein